MSKPKKQRIDPPSEDTAEEDITNPELDTIQEQIEKIHTECQEKILEIDREYQKKKMPLYKERNKLAVAHDSHFWTKTLTNSRLRELITEKDLQLLNYLREIDFEFLAGTSKDFKLSMTFEANPWFENKKLWKEFRFSSKEEDHPRITTSKLQWKKGMDLTQKSISEKKKRNFEPDEESFFTFFQQGNSPDDDYELGSMLSNLWMEPIKTYLGMADSDEEDDFEDLGSDEGREEVEDEEVEEGGGGEEEGGDEGGGEGGDDEEGDVGGEGGQDQDGDEDGDGDDG